MLLLLLLLLLLLKHHFILLKLITIFIIIKNYLSDLLIDSLTDSLLDSLSLSSDELKVKSFFVLIKATFIDFFIKIYALSTHSYTCQKKNLKLFYDNLGCPIHNNKNYMVPSIIIQI